MQVQNTNTSRNMIMLVQAKPELLHWLVYVAMVKYRSCGRKGNAVARYLLCVGESKGENEREGGRERLRKLNCLPTVLS